MGKQRDSVVAHSAYKFELDDEIAVVRNAVSYSANSTSMVEKSTSPDLRPLHNGNAVVYEGESNEVEPCEKQANKVYESLDEEGKSLEQKDPTAEQNGELTEEDLSEGSITLSSTESDDEDQHWLTFLQSLAEKKKRKMLRILHFANRLNARKQSSPLVPHSLCKRDSDDAIAVAGTATTRFAHSTTEQSVNLCQLHENGGGDANTSEKGKLYEEEPKDVEKQHEARTSEIPKELTIDYLLEEATSWSYSDKSDDSHKQTKSARSSSEKKRRSGNALDTPEKKRPKQDTGKIIWKDPKKSGSSGKRKPVDGGDVANKRRKTGCAIDEAQLKLLGPLKLPEFAKGLLAASKSDPQVQKLNAQLSDINRKLMSQEAIDDMADDELSPSPPPVYDGLGIRVNTRGARLRRKLADRRQKIVSDLIRRDPIFEAPKEYRPRKLFKKLYVPVKEYPSYNFVSQIIGPRGCMRRRLERETGARITLRGKGSRGQYKGAKAESWEDEDLHVYIEAASEESMDAAVKMVEKLLVPVQEERNKELSCVNFAQKQETSPPPAGRIACAFPKVVTGECCDRSGKAENVNPAKLFVCYLPWTVDDARLRGLFAPFGPVCESVVVKDKVTGSSRGYGFVKYTSPRFAAEAVTRMNGYRIDGKVLLVRVAGRVPPAVRVARPPRGHENVRPVDWRAPQYYGSVGYQYQSYQMAPSCGLFPLQYLSCNAQYPFVQRQAMP